MKKAKLTSAGALLCAFVYIPGKRGQRMRSRLPVKRIRRHNDKLVIIFDGIVSGKWIMLKPQWETNGVPIIATVYLPHEQPDRAEIRVFDYTGEARPIADIRTLSVSVREPNAEP